MRVNALARQSLQVVSASDAQCRRNVTFTRADQIEPKPVDWLIENWIARDSLVGIVGQPGSCKSFLALDLACRVATGTPWHGCSVRRGQVFLLAGEGIGGLRKRIRAWEIFNRITIAGAPLYIASSLPGLTDPNNVIAVADAITEEADKAFFADGAIDPALIVVDTLARAMHGANENDAGDMGRFIAAMDLLRCRWGATVIAIHHSGHGEGSQERARGSSAFRAALDSEFVMKSGRDGITVRTTKAKDWEPPDPLTLKKVTVPLVTTVGHVVGQPETSLVLADGTVGGTDKERRGEVAKLRQEGLTLRKIVDQTGIPLSTVARWIRG